MAGLFITFEGGEGSGKSSAIKLIEEKLINAGYKVVVTREPGGVNVSEQIRNVILDVNNAMSKETEALLYAASRTEHLYAKVIPLIEKGYIVLSDRYIDSSLAYQGHARGLGIKEVYEINSYATQGYFPDLTIYIDVAPEIGISRIKKNNRNMDRLDLEKMEFHELVREGYLKVAEMFPERIKVINGNRTIDEIYEEIKGIVLKEL